MHKTTNHTIRLLTLSALGLLFMVSCLNVNVEPLQESTTLKADERLMQKADSGDVKAQNELGQFYAEKGYFIEATKWYRKAANQGDAEAQFNMALAFYNGSGVVFNEDSAFFYQLKAAEQGYANAQIEIGACYENGKHVDKDMAKAIYWYEKAAEQNIPMAQYQLSYLYYKGEGVGQDIEKSLHYLREAANYGLPIAQYNLGLLYRDGDLVKRDQNQYVLWVKKAAEQGYANAQMEMAYIYDKGIVVDENKDKSKEMYAQAVVPNQNQYDKFILALSPDLQKQEKSKKNIRIEPMKADEIKTEADQLYQEGFKLMFGNYGDLNVYTQAINYLTQAAIGGKKEAKALLAYCLATGNGIDPSPDAAPLLYVGKGTIKWKGLDGVYTINFEIFYDGTFTKDMEYQR